KPTVLAAGAAGALAGLSAGAGRVSVRAGEVAATGFGVLAAGAGRGCTGSGSGVVAATSAAPGPAASRVITSAFTSLRTCTALTRADSACARSANGPTRTRQAGLPAIVAGSLKPGSRAR